MPDDARTAWLPAKPTGRSEGPCSHCPRRTDSVCALFHAENLDHLVTRRGYQRRTTIRHQGEPLSHVLVFRSGVVSVSRSLSGGRRQVIDFLMAGDCLGLANEASMNLTVSVLEDTQVCRVPMEAVRDKRRSTAFLRGLIRHVEKATERVRNHVVLLGKLSADERVVAFLLRYWAASQRVQTLCARLDLPMTRRDIADHLGLAPETVCRSLSWLQDQQLIVQIPDGIRVLDLQGLNRIHSCVRPVPMGLPPAAGLAHPLRASLVLA